MTGKIIPPQGGASSAPPAKVPTVPRAVADRLEASLEEAYSAMGDASNDFNDVGDGRLMERMRDALDAYRKAVSP